MPPQSIDNSAAYLTAATFLFAVFAGFFIQRQARRYVDIRQNIAHFDGNLSFIYRSLAHFDDISQKKIGTIMRAHYETIINNESWDYHLMHPSMMLMEIHNLINKSLRDKEYKTLQTTVLNRIMAALLDAQIVRKDMISLYYERISRTKWFIIYLLTVIFLVSLFATASNLLFFESLLKASFGTIIIFVVFLLHQLNALVIFEDFIGEKSAHDVLRILEVHERDHEKGDKS